jgi:hypothetical protein
MWIGIGVVAIAFVVAIIYRILMRDLVIMFDLPSGKTVEISDSGVGFRPAPDHYSSDGFTQIEKYISKLTVESSDYKSLMIFSPDGNRGMFFSSKYGAIEANLSVEVNPNPAREKKIRDFFSSLGVEPTSDYLAQNGNIPDSTRNLSYPVPGTASELTTLTKRILQDLCGISPDEPLSFSFYS